MKIQCPACFEHIDLNVDVRRTFHTRRCPQGVSGRIAPGANLMHCYCKYGLDPSVDYQGPVTEKELAGLPKCCKCGDVLKLKGAA